MLQSLRSYFSEKRAEKLAAEKDSEEKKAAQEEDDADNKDSRFRDAEEDRERAGKGIKSGAEERKAARGRERRAKEDVARKTKKETIFARGNQTEINLYLAEEHDPWTEVRKIERASERAGKRLAQRHNELEELKKKSSPYYRERRINPPPLPVIRPRLLCPQHRGQGCLCTHRGWYHKNALVCKPKTCLCDNGATMSTVGDPRCPKKHGIFCLHCHETQLRGYLHNKTTEACDPAHCRCLHGKEVPGGGVYPFPSGPQCRASGRLSCRSCEIGYHRVPIYVSEKGEQILPVAVKKQLVEAEKAERYDPAASSRINSAEKVQPVVPKHVKVLDQQAAGHGLPGTTGMHVAPPPSWIEAAVEELSMSSFLQLHEVEFVGYEFVGYGLPFIAGQIPQFLPTLKSAKQCAWVCDHSVWQDSKCFFFSLSASTGCTIYYFRMWTDFDVSLAGGGGFRLVCTSAAVAGQQQPHVCTSSSAAATTKTDKNASTSNGSNITSADSGVTVKTWLKKPQHTHTGEQFRFSASASVSDRNRCARGEVRRGTRRQGV